MATVYSYMGTSSGVTSAEFLASYINHAHSITNKYQPNFINIVA